MEEKIFGSEVPKSSDKIFVIGIILLTPALSLLVGFPLSLIPVGSKAMMVFPWLGTLKGWLFLGAISFPVIVLFAFCGAICLLIALRRSEISLKKISFYGFLFFLFSFLWVGVTSVVMIAQTDATKPYNQRTFKFLNAKAHPEVVKDPPPRPAIHFDIRGRLEASAIPSLQYQVDISSFVGVYVISSFSSSFENRQGEWGGKGTTIKRTHYSLKISKALLGNPPNETSFTQRDGGSFEIEMKPNMEFIVFFDTKEVDYKKRIARPFEPSVIINLNDTKNCPYYQSRESHTFEPYDVQRGYLSDKDEVLKVIKSRINQNAREGIPGKKISYYRPILVDFVNPYDRRGVAVSRIEIPADEEFKKILNNLSRSTDPRQRACAAEGLSSFSEFQNFRQETVSCNPQDFFPLIDWTPVVRGKK